MPELDIVCGLLRRGEDLLMIRQAGPGEEPYWTVPGGRVEPGERRHAALVREVQEETGIVVVHPGAPAFVVEVDDRLDGWSGIVWTWDVARWRGEVEPRPADPDGLVLEAAWVPLEEACRRLDGISWHPLTARYLRCELEPGTRWRRLVDADGNETVTRVGGCPRAEPRPTDDR
jgi:8-oxo-dGTP diphosphatase